MNGGRAFNPGDRNEDILVLLKNLIHQILIICARFCGNVCNRFWDYLDAKGFIEPIDYAISRLEDHPILKVVLVVLSTVCFLPIIGFVIFGFVTFCLFGVAYVTVLGITAVFVIPIFLFLVVGLSLTAAAAAACYFACGAIGRAVDLENRSPRTTGPLRGSAAHRDD